MAGSGGMMQIVWLIVILWVLAEFVFPLAKKMMGQLGLHARASKMSNYSVSYM